MSAKTLMGRLERQSGQIAILEAKLGEAEHALESEREEGRQLRQALEDERASCGRLQAQLKQEVSARTGAAREVEEARATAQALDSNLQLLRIKLKTLEREKRRRNPFRLRRR